MTNCDKIRLKATTLFSLGPARLHATALQALRNNGQPHQIRKGKGTSPRGVALERFRLNPIGEAFLDLAWPAFRVRIPKPPDTLIYSRVQDSQPPPAIWMKRVDDLELQSSTGVGTRCSLRLFL
jgi:hypothetical protein